jgi:phospholipid transport system substrate-binding protein
MPLEYRMYNADARWQVYDLSIDGISLVSNYRAQFNKVIRTDSYETLVAKLKSRQFSSPAASPSGKVAR